jgi:hypothetical protein
LASKLLVLVGVDFHRNEARVDHFRQSWIGKRLGLHAFAGATPLRGKLHQDRQPRFRGFAVGRSDVCSPLNAERLYGPSIRNAWARGIFRNIPVIVTTLRWRVADEENVVVLCPEDVCTATVYADSFAAALFRNILIRRHPD